MSEQKGPGTPGTLYRPSNGTEGGFFMEEFCFRCKHDSAYTDDEPEKGCQLLAASLGYDKNEAGYPREWIYDEDGWGTCTKFDAGGKP